MKIELEEKKYEKMVMQIQRHTMRMMHKTMDSIMKTLKEKKKKKLKMQMIFKLTLKMEMLEVLQKMLGMMA